MINRLEFNLNDESKNLILYHIFYTCDFSFVVWLKLRMINRWCHNIFGKMFNRWKKDTIKRIENQIGKPFCVKLFDSGFCLTGGFLLDCIYNTNFHTDIDVVQSNKVLQGRSLNLQLGSRLAEPNRCYCDNYCDYDCNCGSLTDRCEHEYYSYSCVECNPEKWHSLELIEDFIEIGTCHQYPPGYNSNKDIFMVETYLIKSSDPPLFMDFITITCSETPKQYVCNHDYAFCRILFDGQSLFIDDIDAILNKKTSFTIQTAINNFNRFSKDSIIPIYDDSGKLTDESLPCVHQLVERYEKYIKQGYQIELDDTVKLIMEEHNMIIKLLD